MAYIDSFIYLGTAQALTATGVSTNTVDLGSKTPTPQIGDGEPMALVFDVTVSADASSGDETYQLQLVQSANADLSSQDVLLATDTGFWTRANLLAGTQVVIPIPPGLPTKRYIGARLVLGGTTPSITLNMYIAPLKDIQKQQTYKSGYTVS